MEIEVSDDTKKIELVNLLLPCLGIADLEAETAKREQVKERDFERKAKELDMLHRDKAAATELARIELEKERMKQQDNQRQRTHESRFDLNKCFKLMPRFYPEQVDVFFDAFERVATERDWPREDWVTLVRREFTGKTQEAYIALSAVDATEYDLVKKAVLRAFELVPEAYRQ